MVQVADDGSLIVDENITFAFDGPFSGAFRDIPLRRGEAIDQVGVFEGERAYSPGASAELGSAGAADTFGTARTNDGLRVVWHYAADSETRTFRVHYRISGLAVAYDDVVDVNFRVWGDEWKVGLSQLTASMVGPGTVLRAWGHPVEVRGDVQIQDTRVLLRAENIPAGQWVELRALFPRSAFTSAEGMRVVGGAGLEKIVGEEVGAAQRAERSRKRIDAAKEHPLRTILALVLLGFVPGAIVVFWVYRRFGREYDTGYDREYEQEPPSPLEPALVTPLVAQRGGVGSNEFTATLFDLIRRGVYKATPVTTEKSVWGGLRTQDVADLEIERGTDQQLTPFEEAVARVVNYVILNGPERLSRFRDKIEDDRAENAERFKKFKRDVGSAVQDRNWFANAGLGALVVSVLVFALPGVLLLLVGRDRYNSVFPSWTSVVLLALGVCALVNAVVIGSSMALVPLWRRRRPDAQAEAERWEAFRRYLVDFPRLQDAPPASLELWERYLVYGIAFGIAERVLQGAHLLMPEELHNASTIYWISPNGSLGSGPSALAISDLSSGFGSALAPPNSGGSGFGGGFSGGGGGGGGGGAGGAW